MISPEQLRAMTPEARTQLLNAYATAFYGTPDFVTKLSADFDVSKATVFRWKKDNNAPWAVIFALDAWQNTDAMAQNILQDWQEVPAQLIDAAQAMSRVGAILARIARRLPAVRDGELEA